MGIAILVAKLLEIERSIGKADPVKVRAMVLEAQGHVLELEQQLIQAMAETQRLRDRVENCEQLSRLSGLSGTKLSKNEEMAMELSRPLQMRRSRGLRRLISDTSTEPIN